MDDSPWPSVLRNLSWLAWLVYPLAIFFGLRLAQPRYVAAVLAGAALLRYAREAGQLYAGLPGMGRAILFGLLALAGAAALFNSEPLLRFYPFAMNVGMLLLFGASLKRPPSLIERLARLREPDLSPAGVRYTHRVTQVWCVFFVLNGVVSWWTAVFASREFWSLYNGLIAYGLMGLLFAGEWLFRRFFLVRAGSP